MGYWSVIAPEASQNLVTNPSVEDATTGYTAVGAAIARDATQQRRGVYSLKLTPTAGVNDGVYYAITLSTTKAYAFSVDGLWVNGVPYKIYIYDVTAGVTLGTALTFTGGGKWERKTVLASTGANTSCRLYVTKNSSASTVIFYLDGFQCEQKAYATTYVDGDQDGCTWDGAAHASTSLRSAQWRLGGKEVDLDSNGITLSMFAGAGMPPLTQLKQDRAILPGSLYRGVKISERVLTLTMLAQGTSVANLHLVRKQLIDLIKPDLATPAQPFLIRYSGAGTMVEMPVVYDSGLEIGNWFGNSETLAMRCIAYDEPLWKEDGERGLAAAVSQNLTVAYIAGRINGLWNSFGAGMNALVSALAIAADGTLYASGNFTNIGGLPVNYIAKWDGSNWSALGSGLSIRANVLVIAPDGSTLYAGGDFTTAGGSSANYVAKWNGSAWSALGTGLNNSCKTIAFAADGTLYAGGTFTTAGGSSANRIAKWDGSNWSAVGTGFNAECDAVAIALDGSTLYAGGLFTTAGGSSANYVAKWNGSAWSALGTGIGGAGVQVYSLAIALDGTLYAGGYFTTAGGSSASCIAKWNGNSWAALGSGTDAIVRSIAIAADGTLYASGNFTIAGGLSLADRIAKWNGTVWSAIDIDLPGSAIGIITILKGANIYIGFDTSGTSILAANYTITTTAYNPSTASTYPIIKIKRTGGAGATLTHLKNETTSKSLYFNYPMANGETLTIDLRIGRKSVVSSAFGNQLNKVLPNSDLSSWALAPGDNLITIYVVPAGSPTVDARMRWDVAHWSADGGAS